MTLKSELCVLGDRAKLFSTAALFHENTKMFSHHPMVEGGVIAVSKEVLQRISLAFKTYPHCQQKVALGKDFQDTEVCLEEVIRRRRSRRDFSGEALKLEELAKLLYFSYGITGSLNTTGVPLPLRAAPSGGALYPLELYPVVLNVEGLEPGIYHYHVRDHALELLTLGDVRESLFNYSLRQTMMFKASVVFLITAMFDRNLWKYRDRGYRYMLFDVGHLAEHLYLMGTAMELSVCAVGGFWDDNMNELLDVDGVHESALYLVVVGKPEGGE